MTKFIVSILTAVIIVVTLLVTFGALGICDHTETAKIFIIGSSEDNNSIVTQCKECYGVLKKQYFKGNPTDTSYLSVMDQDLVNGQYYTITTKVRFDGVALTGSSKVFLHCVNEQDDIQVYFTAYFRSEYREKVVSLEKDDTITFYGKYSSDGFQFIDCELL